MLRCSAIIVTYNSGGHIGACLEALARRGLRDRGRRQCVAGRHGTARGGVRRLAPGSPDGEREEISALALPSTRARATATGDVLLILNPDAIAEPGAVKALLTVWNRRGRSAAEAHCWEADGQPARGFAFRRLPTLAALLCEVLLVNQLWPGNPVNRRYRCLDADYSQQQEVEQPAGACLAITRAAWDSVGGFDEQFFPVWFEDVDLCKRLLEGGRTNRLLSRRALPAQRGAQRGTTVVSR